MFSVRGYHYTTGPPPLMCDNFTLCLNGGRVLSARTDANSVCATLIKEHIAIRLLARNIPAPVDALATARSIFSSADLPPLPLF